MISLVGVSEVVTGGLLALAGVALTSAIAFVSAWSQRRHDSTAAGSERRERFNDRQVATIVELQDTFAEPLVLTEQVGRATSINWTFGISVFT